jgi:hypothetical protein
MFIPVAPKTLSCTPSRFVNRSFACLYDGKPIVDIQQTVAAPKRGRHPVKEDERKETVPARSPEDLPPAARRELFAGGHAYDT